MSDRAMGFGTEITLKKEEAYRVKVTRANGRKQVLSFYADGVHIREWVPTEEGYYTREKFINYDILLFDADVRHDAETFGQDHSGS